MHNSLHSGNLLRSGNNVFVRCYRIWRLIIWLLVTTRRIYGFSHLDTEQRSQALQSVARDILAIVKLRLCVEQPPQNAITPPVLVVSNHVSWLDIFVLMAQGHNGFIAKDSVRFWPLIGTLASHIDTVFINRNSCMNVRLVKQDIAKALANRHNVTFFPESRTSDGNGILPFKTALFQAAIDTGTPVQAIALRYYDEHNQRTTQVSYAGRTSLLTSIWRIAGMPAITVKIDYAPIMSRETVQRNSRGQLKNIAEQFIGSVVTSDCEQ